MWGYTDKPVEKISSDSFGIGMYVSGLCKFIVNCDTPMTVSIQGDWGSGKTSMMNMIKDNVSDDVYPVWFNTWQYSQFNMQDELPVSMLCSLLKSLECKKDYSETIKRLSFGLIRGGVKAVTNAFGFRELGESALEGFESNAADYADEIKDLKDKLQEAINDVVKNKKKKRVVVFVDDLDRLQPAKAVELLEILKVFLDCENCVYVLAVDYEVVTQGIKQKFGDMVGEEKGRSFFDKIIQLPFKMPVAQYNVNQYVEDSFSKMDIRGMSSGDIKDYVELMKLSIGFNPRSMKRLFNTYQLLYIILQDKLRNANVKNERKLLFAIICMQMEFEQLYRYLVDNIAVVKDFNNDNLTEEIKEAIGITCDNELARMVSFMEKFNEVIQLDEDKRDISVEEIKNLGEMLSFSTVTSVSASNGMDGNRDLDIKYKYDNLRIVKEVNRVLNERCKYKFDTSYYKINRGDKKISDGIGRMPMHFSDFSCWFQYRIKTNYKTLTNTLKIDIFAMGAKDKILAFNDFFVMSPLSSFDYIYDEEWGCYSYDDLRKFTASDDIIQIDEINAIVAIVEKALKEFADYRLSRQGK